MRAPDQARPVRTTVPRTGVRRAAALTALAVGAALASAGTVAAAADSAAPVDLLVRAVPGAAPAVAARVRALGGRVVAPLPVIDGFSARATRTVAEQLRHTPGVVAVTADAKVRLASVDPVLGYDPAGDFGSLFEVTKVARAQDAWLAGYTGKGIDVALIDSGVAPVQGLTSGNVVNGPDLSFESQDPGTANLDTFGHGTHMAGIIAGRDVAGPPASYADPTHFTGVAPDSRLISVKVAAHDGAVDVSQVIAAIDWVTQHAHDPGFNIRVLNLSFGTDSTQSYKLDPLVYAAESAWKSGIVVVVAGGNEGSARKTLSDPAMSPRLIAVGAEDPQGTVSTADDVVPSFSSRGSDGRHVDVVAPGVHVLGLTVPGSQVDTDYPGGKVGTRFLRGSGTSQATAVTTGAAALYLQKFPNAKPDQVKRALMQSALPFAGAATVFRGSGALDVRGALGVPPSVQSPTMPFGSGGGSLEAARGSDHVADGGTDLVGEKDIFGAAFSSTLWGPLSLARRAWTAGTWNGSVWTGPGWTGNTWTGRSWAGAPWTGVSWAGTPWAGRTWSGRTWTDSGWSAGSWNDAGWAGRTWTGRTWTGRAWGGLTWN